MARIVEARLGRALATWYFRALILWHLGGETDAIPTTIIEKKKRLRAARPAMRLQPCDPRRALARAARRQPIVQCPRATIC